MNEDDSMGTLINTAEWLFRWNEKRREKYGWASQVDLPRDVDMAIRSLADSLGSLPPYYRARYCRDRLRDDELPLLERSVGWLDSSVRALNCLLKADIRKIGQLCETTPEDLLTIRMFGKGQLAEVRQLLAKHGLKLKGDTWRIKSPDPPAP